MGIIGEIRSPGRLRYMSPDELIFPNGVPEDVQRKWDQAMKTIEESERAVHTMAYDPNICIRIGTLSVAAEQQSL